MAAALSEDYQNLENVLQTADRVLSQINNSDIGLQGYYGRMLGVLKSIIAPLRKRRKRRPGLGQRHLCSRVLCSCWTTKRITKKEAAKDI